ncbi:MAG: DUF2244 domain-containing protein [Rhizobiales bacterium]|nr:DUF2244 domain-containing protein [Hyphomicrobiales bacterium]
MIAPSDIDPLFAVRLTPYRSLGKKGFIILMVSLSAICFAAGILFVTIGAWPVFGFFGLDVLLIYIAFKMNYRAARAYEDVVLTNEELLVLKVDAKGKQKAYVFNPFWVRLSMERLEDEGVKSLTLTSHGNSMIFGEFLNPDDRESFGKALQDALTKARQPVFG